MALVLDHGTLEAWELECSSSSVADPPGGEGQQGNRSRLVPGPEYGSYGGVGGGKMSVSGLDEASTGVP